ATDGADIDLSATDTVLFNEFDQRGHIPVVVGRWPRIANECNTWASGSYFAISPDSAYERDPFDYYDQANGQEVSLKEVVAGGETYEYPIELAEEYTYGEIGSLVTEWRSIGYDSYDFPEFQRGWMYYGQRRTREIRGYFNVGGFSEFLTLQCWGSDKDV